MLVRLKIGHARRSGLHDFGPTVLMYEFTELIAIQMMLLSVQTIMSQRFYVREIVSKWACFSEAVLKGSVSREVTRGRTIH
jgi:hypothetical protein